MSFLSNGLFIVLAVGSLALAACAPAAPSPTAAPPKPAEAKPALSKAEGPAEKTAAKTVSSPAPTPTWEREWQETSNRAKQEGLVRVAAPPGPELPEALTKAFESEYEISVDFVASSQREFSPRVASERAAGQFLWDIWVGSSTTGLLDLVPIGAFQPVEPALLLPDLKEPQLWRDGGLEFLDEGRQLLVMTKHQRGILFVNPNLVRIEDLTSYKDLLDPLEKQDCYRRPSQAGPRQFTLRVLLPSPRAGC